MCGGALSASTSTASLAAFSLITMWRHRTGLLLRGIRGVGQPQVAARDAQSLGDPHQQVVRRDAPPAQDRRHLGLRLAGERGAPLLAVPAVLRLPVDRPDVPDGGRGAHLRLLPDPGVGPPRQVAAVDGVHPRPAGRGLADTIGRSSPPAAVSWVRRRCRSALSVDSRARLGTSTTAPGCCRTAPSSSGQLVRHPVWPHATARSTNVVPSRSPRCRAYPSKTPPHGSTPASSASLDHTYPNATGSASATGSATPTATS